MKRIEQKNTIKKEKNMGKGRKIYQKGTKLIWRWRATIHASRKPLLLLPLLWAEGLECLRRRLPSWMLSGGRGRLWDISHNSQCIVVYGVTEPQLVFLILFFKLKLI